MLYSFVCMCKYDSKNKICTGPVYRMMIYPFVIIKKNKNNNNKYITTKLQRKKIHIKWIYIWLNFYFSYILATV